MDPELIRKYGSQLERVGWALGFFSMLTQIGRFAFPSYNMVLGFWAVYSSFSRHGRATFGYITFSFLSLILDIVFCTLNASEERFAQYNFALVVFIGCMFIKLLGIYTGAHFFSAVGGAYSMEQSLQGVHMGAGDGGGGYEPLNQQQQQQQQLPPSSSSMTGAEGLVGGSLATPHSHSHSHGASTTVTSTPQQYQQQQQQLHGGYYPPVQQPMQQQPMHMGGDVSAAATAVNLRRDREVDDGTL